MTSTPKAASRDGSPSTGWTVNMPGGKLKLGIVFRSADAAAGLNENASMRAACRKSAWTAETSRCSLDRAEVASSR